MLNMQLNTKLRELFDNIYLCRNLLDRLKEVLDKVDDYTARDLIQKYSKILATVEEIVGDNDVTDLFTLYKNKILLAKSLYDQNFEVLLDKILQYNSNISTQLFEYVEQLRRVTELSDKNYRSGINSSGAGYFDNDVENNNFIDINDISDSTPTNVTDILDYGYSFYKLPYLFKSDYRVFGYNYNKAQSLITPRLKSKPIARYVVLDDSIIVQGIDINRDNTVSVSISLDTILTKFVELGYTGVTSVISIDKFKTRFVSGPIQHNWGSEPNYINNVNNDVLMIMVNCIYNGIYTTLPLFVLMTNSNVVEDVNNGDMVITPSLPATLTVSYHVVHRQDVVGKEFILVNIRSGKLENGMYISGNTLNYCTFSSAGGVGYVMSPKSVDMQPDRFNSGIFISGNSNMKRSVPFSYNNKELFIYVYLPEVELFSKKKFTIDFEPACFFNCITMDPGRPVIRNRILGRDGRIYDFVINDSGNGISLSYTILGNLNNTLLNSNVIANYYSPHGGRELITVYKENIAGKSNKLYFIDKLSNSGGDRLFASNYLPSGTANWARIDKENNILNTIIQLNGELFYGNLEGKYEDLIARHNDKYFKKNGEIVDVLVSVKDGPFSLSKIDPVNGRNYTLINDSYTPDISCSDKLSMITVSDRRKLKILIRSNRHNIKRIDNYNKISHIYWEDGLKSRSRLEPKPIDSKKGPCTLDTKALTNKILKHNDFKSISKSLKMPKNIRCGEVYRCKYGEVFVFITTDNRLYVADSKLSNVVRLDVRVSDPKFRAIFDSGEDLELSTGSDIGSNFINFAVFIRHVDTNSKFYNNSIIAFTISPKTFVITNVMGTPYGRIIANSSRRLCEHGIQYLPSGWIGNTDTKKYDYYSLIQDKVTYDNDDETSYKIKKYRLRIGKTTEDESEIECFAKISRLDGTSTIRVLDTNVKYCHILTIGTYNKYNYNGNNIIEYTPREKVRVFMIRPSGQVWRLLDYITGTEKIVSVYTDNSVLKDTNKLYVTTKVPSIEANKDFDYKQYVYNIDANDKSLIKTTNIDVSRRKVYNQDDEDIVLVHKNTSVVMGTTYIDDRFRPSRSTIIDFTNNKALNMMDIDSTIGSIIHDTSYYTIYTTISKGIFVAKRP